MNYQLILNGKTIKRGDLKELMALFDCLSGNLFAKTRDSNWLNKMSASESYINYLSIKRKELKIKQWVGELILANIDGEIERAHLFETHHELLHRPKCRKLAQG